MAKPLEAIIKDAPPMKQVMYSPDTNSTTAYSPLHSFEDIEYDQKHNVKGQERFPQEKPLDFPAILNNTLGFEGGFVKMPEGDTNKGVVQGTYDAYRTQKGLPLASVKNINDTEVRDLYETNYYKAPRFDILPPNVSGVMFDYGVHSGQGTAAKALQGIVGVKQDGKIGPKTEQAVNEYISVYGEKGLVSELLKERKTRLERIIEKNPAKKKYEKGWMNRINKLEELYSMLNPFSMESAYADEVPQERRTTIGPANLPYRRALTEEEKAAAVVDLVNKAHGKPTGAGLQAERAVGSPEAKALTEAMLTAGFTAVTGAVKGVMQADQGEGSIWEMIKANAMQGVLEPETIDPTSVAVMKAYPGTDWRLAAAVGTLADVGSFYGAGKLTQLGQTGITQLSKDRQVMQSLNAVRETPQWKTSINKYYDYLSAQYEANTGVEFPSTMRGDVIARMDKELTQYMWQNRNKINYFKSVNYNLRTATGFDIFSESGQANVVRKGAKETFYKFMSKDVPNQPSGYVPIEGKSVTIPGFEKYAFFIAKTETGEWDVSEVKTGLRVSNIGNTQKEAIQAAAANLEAGTKSMPLDELLEKQLKRQGLSPYYGKAVVPKTEVTYSPNSEKTISEKPLTAQEAVAKGMSAEEWVGSKGISQYHGTHGKFDEFMTPEEMPDELAQEVLGQPSNTFGVYFADNKKFAGQFGKNIIEAKLNIQKPLDLTNVKTFEDLVALLPIDKGENKLDLRNVKSDSRFDDDYFKQDIYRALELLVDRYQLYQKIKDAGYDGIVFNDRENGVWGKTTIVFDKSNIKTRAQLLSEYEQAKGGSAPAEGKVLYHGTSEDFGMFDINKSGSVKYGDWGKGIYLDSSKSGADYYRSEAVKAKSKEVQEAYDKYKDSTKNIKKVNGILQYPEESTQLLKEFQEISERIGKDKTKGKVLEVVLSPNAKIYKHNSVDGLTDPNLANEVKEKGYDAILIDEGRFTEEYVVLNPELLSIKGGSAQPPVAPPPTAVSGEPAPEEPKNDIINLDRLNVTEETKDFIRSNAEPVAKEIEKRTGEPVTFEQVKEAAAQAEILRQGTTREHTLKLEAELLRTRQHLADLAQKGKLTKEYLDSLVAVKSTQSSIARLLGSQRINADPVWKQEMDKIIEKVLDGGAKIDDVLKAAETVNFQSPKEATEFYRTFIKPKLSEIISEYRYINMLSSPLTHIVNSTSNLLQVAGLRPLVMLSSGAIDSIGSSLLGYQRTHYLKEVPAYARGAINALPEAWGNFWTALTGERYLERPDVPRMPSGVKGLDYFQIIPRLLEAEDVFFRALAYRGELEALAAKGITGPQADEQAKKTAAYYIFRSRLDPENKESRSTLLSHIDKMTAAIYQLRKVPGVDWFIPFLETPMNIAKQMIEFSPVGVTTVPGAKDKGEQLAKALVGSMALLASAYMVMRGDSTWSAPTGEKEKEKFYASGRKPYSLRILGHWVSIRRLGTLGFAMALPMAYKYHFYQSKKSVRDDAAAKVGKLLTAGAQYFSDQTFMQALGNIVNASRGDEGTINRTVSNFPSQLIPLSALLRWVTNIVDPIYRKPKKEFSAEGIIQNLMTGIPGLSSYLPAYQDSKKQPSQRPYPMFNAFSPLFVSPVDQRGEGQYQRFLEQGKRSEKATERKEQRRLRLDEIIGVK